MIVNLIAVVLLGLSINVHNSGTEVQNFNDVKSSVVKSVKNSTTANHGNYNQ